MRKHIEPRRHLITFQSSMLPHIFTDVLVIGSGVAGLSAAIAAAEHSNVLVVAKDAVRETNTEHAQGGIAVALHPDDSIESHFKDTMEVGYGLCEPEVVRLIVSEGPDRIRELLGWGADFDRRDNTLEFAREGGHSRPRIIHAHGDSTGTELQRSLLMKCRECKRIKVIEYSFAIDLLTLDNTCHGALIDRKDKGLVLAWAKQTILATGGLGQTYRETTNPDVATGDGFAMAYRAGAQLRDMEFVQFHPTTLYIAGASRTLITEAVRGAGGILRNRHGERFMPRYHKDAELAPRDVVSRAILVEMRDTKDTNVYLDLTHLSSNQLDKRFPRIRKLCNEFDIDISEEFFPVCPSAHYAIGGVAVDANGCTTVNNLLACGEVSSTGLHGANRLGSNSLLEGLVYGRRAGCCAGETASLSTAKLTQHKLQDRIGSTHSHSHIDIEDVRNSLKSLMWRCVGPERSARGLEDAKQRIDFWCSYVFAAEFKDPEGWMLQNMLTVSKMINVCALARHESRGAHYRTDFPSTDDKDWKRHSIIQKKVSGERQCT